jgi:rhodanese-related sulfurtransferase
VGSRASDSPSAKARLTTAIATASLPADNEGAIRVKDYSTPGCWRIVFQTLPLPHHPMRYLLLCLMTFASSGALVFSAERPPDEPFVRELSGHEATVVVRAHQIRRPSNPSAPPLTVLDVRTADEFNSGHIEGALNLDFKSPDFEKELRALDKEKPYLVHCARGNRSAKARDAMKKLGFTKIYHITDGFESWKAAGGAVVKKG